MKYASLISLFLFGCSAGPTASTLDGTWQMNLMGGFDTYTSSFEQPFTVHLSDLDGILVGESELVSTESLGGCDSAWKISVSLAQSTVDGAIRLSAIENFTYSGNCSRSDQTGESASVELTRVDEGAGLEGGWSLPTGRNSSCDIIVQGDLLTGVCGNGKRGSGVINDSEVSFVTDDGDGFVMTRVARTPATL